uniref:Putative neurotoxin NaH-Cpp1a n=1 Tax=Calliactis polypus TaxID=656064 RepID=NATX2_CALPY
MKSFYGILCVAVLMMFHLEMSESRSNFQMLLEDPDYLSLEKRCLNVGQKCTPGNNKCCHTYICSSLDSKCFYR